VDVQSGTSIGVWAGGARAPQNFYGRAKSNAKFGQNLKILICPEKVFVFSRKLRDVRGNFVICPENFFQKNNFW
jgi:hypothetical protein